MMEERLFAVYVGGMAEGCHVELHDMRFAVGATIEECYDDLQAQWWGTPESFHIDAFGAIEWVDGHTIELGALASTQTARLWFLNLGGYDPAQFTELHENVFVVAADWREAKRKALAAVSGWTAPHKDAVYEIENVVDVAAALGPARHIVLRPDLSPRPFRFEARYIPVGRMK
jgi:hypothetical protein